MTAFARVPGARRQVRAVRTQAGRRPEVDVDPATAAATSVYKGKTYYFCAKDEKEQFDKAPEKYLKGG